MKIALANHGIFPDVIGGMERHTFNLAKHLKHAGVDVHVLVPEPKTGTPYPFPVHHLPWPKKPVWLWANREFSRNVGKWIDDNGPDLAFGQGFNLWAYLPRKRIPCVFHPHGLEMFGSHLKPGERVLTFPFRRLVRKQGRLADATISLGGNLTHILEERAGVPHDRLCEIPNAVDPEIFPTFNADKKPRSLLWIGRLAFNKGVDFLAEVLRRTRGLPYDLTVIGDGPFRPTVEELAARDPRLHYVPRVTEAQLHEAYSRHECLLFTSRFEGMPTVILEALALRCAVIATRIGAVETMVNSNYGVLVEPNPGSIAAGIEQYLSFPETERRAMGQRGSEFVRTHLAWPRVLPLYLALFDRLVSSHS